MKHLLSVCDMADDVLNLVNLANDFKTNPPLNKPLNGKSLAMIFQKASTRTRVSFEVGMEQLGGNALFLSSSDLQIGRGEPISDTAKVLSRYVDAIMIRATKHKDVQVLAEYSDIPVISGLTDIEHPCQALADALTILNHKNNFDVKICYIGDGNNVCNSLILISAYLGMDIAVAAPEEYFPNSELVNKALDIAKKTGSNIEILSDIDKAIENSDVVYTDVWVSMGDEDAEAERVKKLSPYQVNNDLMKKAKDDAIFMHCLPAIRGKEVSSDVIDGPQSVVFDQAENRMHAQKAILYHFLK